MCDSSGTLERYLKDENLFVIVFNVCNNLQCRNVPIGKFDSANLSGSAPRMPVEDFPTFSPGWLFKLEQSVIDQRLNKGSQCLSPSALSWLQGNVQTTSSDSSGDVHVTRPDEHLPVPRPEFPRDVQTQHYRGREVVFEKHLCVGTRAQREEGGVKGGDHGEGVQSDSDVRAGDTERGAVGELVLGEAVGGPSASEANVSQVDAEPHEEETQPGQREEPREDFPGRVSFPDVGETAKQQLDHDAPDRTTFLVHVHQEPRPHASRGERLHGPRRSIGAAVRHADDGDGDDGVHHTRQTFHTRVLDGEDKRRSFCVGTARSEKVRAVGGDDQADDEQGQDVEGRDAPKDLSGRLGERTMWVFCFSCGETDEFCASEGESGRDKHRAETLEPVSKSARVLRERDVLAHPETPGQNKNKKKVLTCQ